MRSAQLLILTAFSVLCSAGLDASTADDSVEVDPKKAIQPKQPVKLKIGTAYKVVTKQGRVYKGVLTRKGAQTITLKLTTGRSLRILRKDIEAIREVEVPVTRRREINRKQHQTQAAALVKQ